MLIVFLGNVRAGLIVASVIPLAMLFGFILMRVFGVSVITDLGGKDITEVPTHEEVQKAAEKAQPNVVAIIREMVARL